MTHPTVDVVTDRVAVVVQERQVVPFTSWIADALRVCGATGRGLQVVTPPDARLTWPLRLVLSPPPSRWVVRGPDGYYDGLTGAVLAWDGGAFDAVRDGTGAGTLAPSFTRTPPSLGAHLILTLRVCQPPAPNTELGGAVEHLWRSLTGAPPSGWGTAEPAAQPWNPGGLTEMCRDRAPEPTWAVLVGGPAGETGRPSIGTLLVSRVQGGVEEAAHIVIGYRPGEEVPSPGLLRGLADDLARGFSLTSLFVQRGAGPADVTALPHWVGVPGPVGMAVGPGGLQATGLDRALSAPMVTAHRIGGDHAPSVWFDIGDGVSPEGFSNFERLMAHLGVPAQVGGSG